MYYINNLANFEKNEKKGLNLSQKIGAGLLLGSGLVIGSNVIGRNLVNAGAAKGINKDAARRINNVDKLELTPPPITESRPVVNLSRTSPNQPISSGQLELDLYPSYRNSNSGFKSFSERAKEIENVPRRETTRNSRTTRRAATTEFEGFLKRKRQEAKLQKRFERLNQEPAFETFNKSVRNYRAGKSKGMTISQKRNKLKRRLEQGRNQGSYFNNSFRYIADF
jgi:hypothetical protein